MVVAIDRIGRSWQDTIRSICELRDRGVKIRSLAEAQWTRYLEADEGSPESFFGQVLTLFAAWVAYQELESIKRRTREGLERARQQGKTLGPPRKFNRGQVGRRCGGCGMRAPASGGSRPTSSARPAPSCECCSGKGWVDKPIPVLGPPPTRRLFQHSRRLGTRFPSSFSFPYS